MSNRNNKAANLWQRLDKHQQAVEKLHMKELFAEDADRADKFSLDFNDFLVDFSKHRITEETIDLLLALADSVALRDKIKAMFAGERINVTEDRAALHTALRAPLDTHLSSDEQDISRLVHNELDRCRKFVEQVHSGTVTGNR